MSTNTGETEIPLSEVDLRELVTPYLRAAWAAVKEDLPAWIFFFNACLLLNTSLTNLNPPRPDFASTIVFPMGMFVMFSTVRALKSRRVRFPRAALVVPVVLALGLPLANVLHHRPFPIEPSTLRLLYELSNFFWAGLLVHYLWKKEKSLVALFFGVGLAYGAILENGGILLGFFDEQHLTATVVKPFVAPVATMVGWSMVLALATHLVWRLREWLPWLRERSLLSGALVGIFATTLDLQIDPIATATNCWVWHHSLPPWFHGVPLVNFVAWLCALVPFAWVMFRVQKRLGLVDGQKWTSRQLGVALAFVPYAAMIALIAFLVSTALLEGTNGTSWNLFAELTAKWVAAVFG